MEKEKDNLIEEPKKHHKLKIFFIIIILILIIIFVYSRFLIHKFIVIKEYPVIAESLPSSFNGFKITQFSDIHFGRTITEKEVSKTVELINQTNADIVVFTGDLFDNSINLSDKNIDFLKNELKKIKANYKKYAVKGDNDYINEELWNSIMTDADFKILNNENELIYYKGLEPLMISGIPSIQKETMNLESTFKTTETNIAYHILLTHEPKIVNEIGDTADLILTGHSLGGLIKLPYTNGLIQKEYTNNYLEGKYDIQNKTMYVSSGLGTETYSFRFLNPPSINFYRLYNYI